MYRTTMQDFGQFLSQPRSISRVRWLKFIAVVIVLALIGLLTIIMFRSGYVNIWMLTHDELTPTPTPNPTPMPKVITRDNVNQLVLQQVLGYGTVTSLNWLAETNQVIFTTTSSVVGFLDPKALSAPPQLWNQKYVEGENISSLDPNSFGIAPSPNGKTVALSQSAGVSLWDTVSGTQRGSLDISYTLEIAYGSTDTGILASAVLGNIHLWDRNTGNEIRRWKGSNLRINSLAFSPDDKLLATGGAEKIVKLWDVATGEQLAILEGHQNPVNSIAFSPDGNIIASAGQDGMVWLWNWRAAAGSLHGTLQKKGEVISQIVFSPDGKILAAASDNKTIHLWDLVKMTTLGTLKGHTNKVKAITFNPDGTQVISGSVDGTVRLWDVAAGTEVQQVAIPPGQHDGVFSAAFSPDGKTLVSAGLDQTVVLWDVATGVEQSVWHGHGGMVLNVVFSPDGATVASASFDGTVRLWDVASRTLDKVLDGHAGSVLMIAFSPDGKTLASGQSGNHMIQLWDVATGAQLPALEGHLSNVTGLGFSPDGSLLVSGAGFNGLRAPSPDTSVRLWDAVTGKQLRVLEGHTQTLIQNSFSPDGTLILSASQDGTIRIWGLPPGGG